MRSIMKLHASPISGCAVHWAVDPGAVFEPGSFVTTYVYPEILGTLASISTWLHLLPTSALQSLRAPAQR